MICKGVLINLIILELILAYRKDRVLSVGLERPLARTVDLFINFPKTVHALWFPYWLQRFLLENVELLGQRLLGLSTNDAAKLTVKIYVLITLTEVPYTFSILSFFGFLLLAAEHELESSGQNSSHSSFDFGFEALGSIFFVIDSKGSLFSYDVSRLPI